jgi:hypothetical protein
VNCLLDYDSNHCAYYNAIERVNATERVINYKKFIVNGESVVNSKKLVVNVERIVDTKKFGVNVVNLFLSDNL